MSTSRNVDVWCLIGISLAAFSALAWIIGSSVYWSTLGVLLELSLWLPRGYHLRLPEGDDPLNLLVFLCSVSIGARLSTSLVIWPGPFDSPESRERRRIALGGSDADEYSKTVFEWLLVTPFSVGAWRGLLVFVILAAMEFPNLEYQRARNDQDAVVARLASWLDFGQEDLDRAEVSDDSDFVRYKVLDGEVDVTPFLNCEQWQRHYFPVSKSACTTGALAEAYRTEWKSFTALEAHADKYFDGYTEPRGMLPLVLVIWIAGTLVTLRLNARLK